MFTHVNLYREMTQAEFHPQRRMITLLGWPPGGIIPTKVYDFKKKSRIQQKLEQIWISIEFTANLLFLLLIILSFCLYPSRMFTAIFNDEPWVAVGFLIILLFVLYRFCLLQAYLRWMSKNKTS